MYKYMELNKEIDVVNLLFHQHYLYILEPVTFCEEVPENRGNRSASRGSNSNRGRGNRRGGRGREYPNNSSAPK